MMRDFCRHGPLYPAFFAAEDPGPITCGRTRVPDGTSRLRNKLSVMTLSDEEIAFWGDAGVCTMDLIDEHTTTFWFDDRASFRIAYRIARGIMKGGRMSGGLEAGMIFYSQGVDGQPCEMAIDPSPHHILTEAA